MLLSDEVIRLFPEHLRFVWRETARQAEKLCEIRLRANQPVMIYLREEEFYMQENGSLTTEKKKGRLLPKEELDAVLKHLCHYSLYACEKEMSRGFVSADGGFRIGIAGEAVLHADGTVKNIRSVSSMNIRIAREVKGAGIPVLSCLYQKGEFMNTLILSPPGCGKTTLLRDLIRLISDGNEWGAGRNVGVVDERSEIADCLQGIPQNDLGCRTDVLDGCPKELGMMMLIRTMAPKVLAVDELGGAADVLAIGQAIKCGCSVLATVHGASWEELCRKQFIKPLLAEQVFKRFLILGKQGGRYLTEQILDADGKILAAGIEC